MKSYPLPYDRHWHRNETSRYGTGARLAEMVCRFKSQFTSEYLLAFQCGSSPRSHFYLFPMLRRVACVQTSPMIEWQKPNRYVTIHFENKRGEASLRNRNCAEITIGYSSPISYCFLVGTWAFRYFVIIASEFRPMPWVSRISDDRQTLAFSRALISFSALLQTPFNFIQANSLTLRKSGLRLCGCLLTKRPHWKGQPPCRKRNGLSTPRKNAANG